jgi:hypothetical protein
MLQLHFAEFLKTGALVLPFRLSVIGDTTPPVLDGLRVLVVSLK